MMPGFFLDVNKHKKGNLKLSFQNKIQQILQSNYAKHEKTKLFVH